MSGKTNTENRLMMREHVLATASGGMAIALATMLSLITLYRMPQGGSITPASMLPIVFFALAFGPAWGIGAGLVFGMLQFAIAPYAAHWASIVLDYPLAYGLLGLAGFFAASRSRRAEERNVLLRLSAVRMPAIVAAIWLSMLARTVSHLLSGVIFYRSFAIEAGQNPWIYSIVYNITYMIPEAVITSLVLIPMALLFRRR